MTAPSLPPPSITNMAKTPTKRLYVIADAEGATVALVNSVSAAQAARHYLLKNFSVKYAEQHDVFAAAKAGLVPEDTDDKGSDE